MSSSFPHPQLSFKRVSVMGVFKIEPLLLIGVIVSVVAIAIVFIIFTFHEKKERCLNSQSKVLTEYVEPIVSPASEDPLENSVFTRTVKKSISFNTVYNLEEFMVRLYKVGFLVRRLKNGGKEKERFITIDQKGRIRFHKVLEKQKNQQPVRCPKPYFSFPISTLRECFACDDNGIPSFIMDFQGKTLHLSVASKADRDYIVKGINLVVQRAKHNSNFLLRSSSLLQDGPVPPESPMRMEAEEYEYEDDDASQMSATTMNTTSRSYYNNQR